jgi:peptidoglycan/xylan/chitin deacetylase (PgdA/CDA1 family)
VICLVLGGGAFLTYRHVTYDQYSLSSLARLQYTNHKPTQKLVALSFDDGPDPDVTPYVLEILRREHVPGTFFEVGKRVDRYPNIARQVVREGNTVGNHSYSHPDFSKLSIGEQKLEVKEAQEAIHRATGVYPNLFRFPEGAASVQAQDWLYQAGIMPTYWYEPTDSEDWQGPGPARILATLKKHTVPGAVILLHDYPVAANGKNQLSFLPAYINWARNHGYTFARIAPDVGHLNRVVKYSEIKLTP